jgi:hypothetical protein
MAIDYKSKDFHKECKKYGSAHPGEEELADEPHERFGYFDVLFDNVGGEMRTWPLPITIRFLMLCSRVHAHPHEQGREDCSLW